MCWFIKYSIKHKITERITRESHYFRGLFCNNQGSAKNPRIPSFRLLPPLYSEISSFVKSQVLFRLRKEGGVLYKVYTEKYGIKDLGIEELVNLFDLCSEKKKKDSDNTLRKGDVIYLLYSQRSHILQYVCSFCLPLLFYVPLSLHTCVWTHVYVCVVDEPRSYKKHSDINLEES